MLSLCQCWQPHHGRCDPKARARTLNVLFISKPCCPQVPQLSQKDHEAAAEYVELGRKLRGYLKENDPEEAIHHSDDVPEYVQHWFYRWDTGVLLFSFLLPQPYILALCLSNLRVSQPHVLLLQFHGWWGWSLWFHPVGVILVSSHPC